MLVCAKSPAQYFGLIETQEKNSDPSGLGLKEHGAHIARGNAELSAMHPVTRLASDIRVRAKTSWMDSA